MLKFDRAFSVDGLGRGGGLAMLWRMDGVSVMGYSPNHHRDAEAYGLRQAIIWVLKLEFPSVVFELDAKMVVDAFYATNDDNSEFGIAIKECRFLYRYKPNFFVCFTRREANKPAHKLARESYMLASPFHSALPPSCIK